MSSRSRRILVAALLALPFLAAGCASARTVSPTSSIDPATVGEKPEPLPPGVKPLTVEQDEMISQ